jgi:prefoldin alpha subunit
MDIMSVASDKSRQQELAAIEQRMNELVQQSRILEAYMNDIMTRQVAVNRAIEEARLASTTIQNVTSESDVESLMPIGIGVYIKATVPPIKKLLVNLDAGIAIEKTRDDALNYVESRIKEYEVAARQLEAQRQQIEMHMNQLQTQINQMIQAAQQQQQQQQQLG